MRLSLHLRFILFAAVFAWVAGSGAARGADAPPATQPAAGASAADWVRQLADDRTADTAEIGLAMLAVTSLDSIEAAYNDPSLAPAARQRLKTFLDRERPLKELRLRVWKQHEQEQQWKLKNDLAAYEAGGSKNAKWDAAARSAIELFCRGELEPAGRAAEQAIAVRCNDPLIYYIQARTTEKTDQAASPQAVQRLYEKATSSLENSHYGAYRKLDCFLDGYNQLLDSEVARLHAGETLAEPVVSRLNVWIEVMMRDWPQFVNENPPERLLGEKAIALIDFPKGQAEVRRKLYLNVMQPLLKAHRDSSVFLTIKGHFYIKSAWDARGSGWANTVTGDGFRLFKERLAKADEALIQAWEKDNTNSDAAVEMITVELGQGQGRDRMELWFTRALEADPDNHKAFMGKLTYLFPRWHGKAADLLAFGRECDDSGRWRAKAPLILAEAYHELTANAENAAEMLAAPQFWEDVTRLYVPYLTVVPNDFSARSRYCFFACQTGHWDIARQQFQLLGDHIVITRFHGGVKEMENFRKTAQERTDK